MSMEEEVAALGVDEVVRNGMTVFPRDDQGKTVPVRLSTQRLLQRRMLYASRVVAARIVRQESRGQNESSKIKAYKEDMFHGLIFVNPRRVPFVFDGQVGSCQRPLRAQTAQGERIAIANSETVPAARTST